MPEYIYVREDADPVTDVDIVKKIYPISAYRRRRMFNGKWYVVSTVLQQAGMMSGVGSNSAGEKLYPKFSEAMGINPRSIPEAQEVYRQAGLGPQEFNADGEVKVTGMKHQRKLEKARGFVNRASYYG